MSPRIILILGLLVSCCSGRGAEPVVDETQLPRVPATPPDQALSTFKVRSGFRVELVAAEPLVADPIALSFDEAGRLYVVEMRDYSERRPDKLGRIRLLEDLDWDGRVDRSTVFAEGLPWPTAVICHGGGVFVGSTPDILWMQDTNGDGVADVREVVFTGFAADYAPYATNQLNVQAMLNSFNWSLDNRIHGATSFNGGKVRLLNSAFVRGWVAKAGRNKPDFDTVHNLRGRDFSFDPRTLELRAESGGGQHGMSFDSQGRKFACANSSHLQAVIYEERYAAGQPSFSMPRALVDIAVDGGAAPVFRISPDEPWRVLRTRWRVAGLVPGPIEGGGRPSGYFTGATGVTIYRGDAYGAEFVEDAFVGDAGGNLVHRKKILQDGAGLTARRPGDERDVEFLASRDNWFRPVQFANAPDGCLYICDMYREVIEHPWSLPQSLKRHLDLNSGNDRGRIYRIVPEGYRRRGRPELGRAGSSELVALLGHPNGWTRDTAARLLIERQDTGAIGGLERVVRDGDSMHGRLHALYALAGLGALKEEQLVGRMSDVAPEVRRHAVRLSERRLRGSDHSQLADAVVARGLDTDARVLLQAGFTLVYLPSSHRARAAETILRNPAADSWVRSATVASMGDSAGEVFGKLLTSDLNASRASEILPTLARAIGMRNRPEEIDALVRRLPHPKTNAISIEIVLGFAEGLRMANSSLQRTISTERLAEFFEAAGEWVTNTSRIGTDAAGNVIGASVQLLAHSSYAQAAPVLLELMVNPSPSIAPSAAVSALGRFNEAALARDLLSRWSNLTPSVRSDVIELLLKRPERIRPLLGAIARGDLRRSELNAAQQAAVRTHRDSEIRLEAERILGKLDTSSRQSVVDSFQQSLKLTGSAAKGRGIFETRCGICHKLGALGHELGPDLATVKNAGKEKLLANILDPSREMNGNFAAYAVDTREGENLVGIIVGENAGSVTLRMAGGTEMNLPRGTIARLQAQGRSLMPDGLEEGLSQQDMADLLEFILATP